MAANRRLRHPCHVSPERAPASSSGAFNAILRVVRGTMPTAPTGTPPGEGWSGDAVGAEGWWGRFEISEVGRGCPRALLHLPGRFCGEEVPPGPPKSADIYCSF